MCLHLDDGATMTMGKEERWEGMSCVGGIRERQLSAATLVFLKKSLAKVKYIRPDRQGLYKYFYFITQKLEFTI